MAPYTGNISSLKWPALLKFPFIQVSDRVSAKASARSAVTAQSFSVTPSDKERWTLSLQGEHEEEEEEEEV